MRDEGLYKGAGHETFEAYCKVRWDLRRSHAYELIEASGVVFAMANMKVPPPASERVCRPLIKLPPSQQQRAWARAIKTAPSGVVTARHVAAVVAGFLPRPEAPAGRAQPVAPPRAPELRAGPQGGAEGGTALPW